MSPSRLTLNLLLAALLGACASQTPPTDTPQARLATHANTDGTGSTSALGSSRGQAADLDTNAARPTGSIYFDYDRHELKRVYQPLVERYAQYLNQHGAEQMLIQGTADERGSREYNLALGQRRANMLRQALEALGVSPTRIEAVSLGEEKPACTDATEACYARNRRADPFYKNR